MQVTRRTALAFGVAGAAVTALPFPARAALEDEVMAFTGGVTPGEGGIILTAPEIAENGNAVPISVEAEGARRIALFAPLNPDLSVCAWTFGPLAARPFAATRIRLTETQDLLVVAELADGSFVQVAQEVKVTIGGCGG
jgi:sulfur-oxidizing protein SoxY